jgi:hypothetical protein
MIEGLKLTMTGVELRARLQERVEVHTHRAEWYKRQAQRTPEEQTDDEPLLPDHMCEFEIERHEWRAEVLAFIRDRIAEGEVFRLGEADLAFGEILPEKPGCVEQDDYEREQRIGFSLERLTKEIGSLSSGGYALASRGIGDDIG